MVFFLYYGIAIVTFITARARRPSCSGLCVGVGIVSVGVRATVNGPFVATACDRVVTAHHVLECGIDLVFFCLSVACGTRVARVAAQSVGPAIVKLRCGISIVLVTVVRGGVWQEGFELES